MVNSLQQLQHPLMISLTAIGAFWLASFTKAITAMAAMQLWEQGKLQLDSEEQLEELYPEGGRAQIITGFDGDGMPMFSTPERKMTARMLLSHTSK